MEIISKSNHGFRLRPSFQKIVNKPNKDINYVVNPKQAVRDSYEFSNLINGEIEVEDEIKNMITDEIFHNEVKKEIERRQTMEQNRRDKTAADLRSGGFPTNLPEMGAQMQVDPVEEPIAAPTSPAAAATRISIGGSSNLPSKTRQRLQQLPEVQPMEVDKPIAPSIENEDEFMNVAETAGGKRKASESETDTARINKAARGNEIVKNFNVLVQSKYPRITVPAIKQQLIMRDISFPPETKKKQDLLMLIDKSIKNNKWTDDVDTPTIKTRLNTYKNQYTSLPLDNVKSKAKAEKPHKLKEDEEDISQYQQAPIVAPSRANITILREQLMKAQQSGKIKEETDKTIYKSNMNFKEYTTATQAVRKLMIKNLRVLYARYVYYPTKATLKSKQSQESTTPGIKQTIKK